MSAHRDAQARLVAAATRAVPVALGALGLPVDVCILASVALGDALAALGCGKTTPVPVSFIAFNPPMTRAILELGHAPTDAEMRTLLAADPARYTIGVAPPGTRVERPNRWDGHLVLVWRDRLLLDPTLGQAARPAWGITLGAHVSPGHPPGGLTWLARGRAPAITLQGDCLVVYWPLPDVAGQIPHTASRHWSSDDPTRRALAHLIEHAVRAVASEAAS